MSVAGIAVREDEGQRHGKEREKLGEGAVDTQEEG